MKKYFGYLLILAMLGIAGCGEDDGVSDGDNFDRGAMLANWADNIIVPAYDAYASSVSSLENSADAFAEAPTVANLAALRSSWLNAYTAWQSVSMFEIGPAEQRSLRNYSNVYPVNVPDMEATIASGSFALESVNKQDEQGFAALDYLINGMAETDEAIVEIYLQETAASNHDDYLVALAIRLNTLASEVLTDWQTGYRDTFVTNDGSDATSSVNKLVNDLLFYYEKHLRAGKIGIPAGVFSSTPLSDRVEALFSNGSSKVLFNTALDAYQDFFNGKHFNSNASGESLNSYLAFLNTLVDGEPLDQIINLQFEAARAAASNLEDDFEAQVINDNSLMLQTYDELQKNVVNMKVDMLSALSIRVDFVDADGD